MSTVRIAATVLFGLRVAYGAALLAAPDRITKRWLGPVRETAAAKVALRALGAREVAVHALGAAAALPSPPPGAPPPRLAPSPPPLRAASTPVRSANTAAAAPSLFGLPGGAA